MSAGAEGQCGLPQLRLWLVAQRAKAWGFRRIRTRNTSFGEAAVMIFCEFGISKSWVAEHGGEKLAIRSELCWTMKSDEGKIAYPTN